MIDNSIQHAGEIDLLCSLCELWAFPPVMQPDLPGCAGALVKMEGNGSGAGSTIIYFSCEDCALKPHAPRRAAAKFKKRKRLLATMASSR